MSTWTPLPYMERAAAFLVDKPGGGLPLEPGGRKTSIVLEAFRRLQEEGQVRRMLVIAPKRVALNTWPDEVRKWDCFAHLRISLVMGDRKKRVKALAADADLYVTNPEEVKWICDHYGDQPLPFDVVTIDELTRFKNTGSQRFKALRKSLGGARRWGLTGSLTSNGYLDVFGQQLLLDGGRSLGRFITRYREKYFTNDFTGFVWTIKPGADKQIAKAIEPYWFAVDPAEYQQLPELVDDLRNVRFDDKTRKLYAQLADQYIIQLGGESIAAPNAAACYTKLAQLANGCVYSEEGEDVHVHDLKLDALEDLVEELDGTPLLIGYEFRHDLRRIEQRLMPYIKAAGYDKLPSLGGSWTPRQEQQLIGLWNEGRLPFLAAHPASAGHGLNLQEANACHVCWFSLPWSWELYDQFVRRVRRNGNDSQRVFNHILRVPDTLDDIKLTGLAAKCTTYGEFTGYLRKLANGESLMSTANGLPAGWTTPVKIGETPAPTQQETTQKAQRQRIADAVTAYERPIPGDVPHGHAVPQEVVVEAPETITNTPRAGETAEQSYARTTEARETTAAQSYARAEARDMTTKQALAYQATEAREEKRIMPKTAANAVPRKGEFLADKLEAQARELLAIADALRFG